MNNEIRRLSDLQSVYSESSPRYEDTNCEISSLIEDEKIKIMLTNGFFKEFDNLLNSENKQLDIYIDRFSKVSTKKNQKAVSQQKDRIKYLKQTILHVDKKFNNFKRETTDIAQLENFESFNNFINEGANLHLLEKYGKYNTLEQASANLDRLMIFSAFNEINSHEKDSVDLDVCKSREDICLHTSSMLIQLNMYKKFNISKAFDLVKTKTIEIFNNTELDIVKFAINSSLPNEKKKFDEGIEKILNSSEKKITILQQNELNYISFIQKLIYHFREECDILFDNLKQAKSQEEVEKYSTILKEINKFLMFDIPSINDALKDVNVAKFNLAKKASETECIIDIFSQKNTLLSPLYDSEMKRLEKIKTKINQLENQSEKYSNILLKHKNRLKLVNEVKTIAFFLIEKPEAISKKIECDLEKLIKKYTPINEKLMPDFYLSLQAILLSCTNDHLSNDPIALSTLVRVDNLGLL